MNIVHFQQLIVSRPKLAQAKLSGAGAVSSKHGAEKEDTMKTSMLMKTVAALAIGAAFPLGAIAAPPAKLCSLS